MTEYFVFYFIKIVFYLKKKKIISQFILNVAKYNLSIFFYNFCAFKLISVYFWGNIKKNVYFKFFW